MRGSADNGDEFAEWYGALWPRVLRAVTVSVTVLGPEEGSVDGFEHASRVIDSAAGPVTIVPSLLGGPYDPAPDREAFRAHWPAGTGSYWTAWVRGPMPDAELVELAESVRLSDGSIDLGGWSGAEDAARVWEPRSEVPPVPDRTTYNVRGSVDLAASDGGSENPLWIRAEVGDRFVDVDGVAGLLSERDLFWVTADGVLARLSGADGDDLLDIARTVRPVPADDERLVEAWQGPDS